MDREKLHKEICERIHEIYKRKNADYGDSFKRAFDKYGLTSAMIRIEDKWNRLDNLVNGKATRKVNESVEDTLMDLANYCLLTLVELEARDAE